MTARTGIRTVAVAQEIGVRLIGIETAICSNMRSVPPPASCIIYP